MCESGKGFVMAAISIRHTYYLELLKIAATKPTKRTTCGPCRSPQNICQTPSSRSFCLKLAEPRVPYCGPCRSPHTKVLLGPNGSSKPFDKTPCAMNTYLFAVLAEALLVQVLRDLRRLARPCLPDDNQNLRTTEQNRTAAGRLCTCSDRYTCAPFVYKARSGVSVTQLLCFRYHKKLY
jgi:hypothetical protein